MSATTLSIVIPTYNRGKLLAYLLDSISSSFTNWPDDLQLVVIDNASTDSTSAVIESFIQRGVPLEAHRQSENIGMDGNLAACFDLARGKYFWQIGDDELLYRGTLPYVLELCRTNELGIIHMSSDSFGADEQPQRAKQTVPSRPDCRRVRSAQLIRSANVFLTFISANIVNRALILSADPDFDARSEMRSSVPQLAWICDSLKYSDHHLLITTSMFGALQGNTGGYGLIDVFARNFTAIVTRRLASKFSDAARIVSNAVLLQLLPSQLLATPSRPTKANSFAEEDVRGEMDSIYKTNRFYLTLVRPLFSGSPTRRRITFFMLRVFNRLNRAVDYRLL